MATLGLALLFLQPGWGWVLFAVAEPGDGVGGGRPWPSWPGLLDRNEVFMELFIAAVLGVVIGGLLGALGAGGSIISIPALIYVLGQDPMSATTASLVIVSITAGTAAFSYYRRGDVDFGTALIMVTAGIPGTYVGSMLAAKARDEVLLSALSVLLVVVGTLMIRGGWKGKKSGGKKLSAERASAGAATWLPLIATGLGIGLLTGFFGVGAGFAIVPALTLLLGFNTKTAVGTSLVVIALNSLVTFTGRVSTGASLDWAMVAAFTVCSVGGSLVGAKVAAKFSEQTLKIIFGVMLLLIAVYMGTQNISALF